MQRRRRGLLRGAVLLACLPAATLRAQAAADTPLTRIDDLRSLLASVARERRPLLLFFSTPGCPYCREVRRGYLRPRVDDGAAVSGVAIREVEITSSRRLRDASGEMITEAVLAARYGVKMVPHLELLGSSAEPLVKSLVGIDSSGFYESFLQSAIAQATAKLGR
jgi:thioredoxin-related protein